MKKTIYQVPAIEVIVLQQEGILCGSDTASFNTGASWELDDLGTGEGFIL